MTETQPAGFDDGGETAGTSGGDDSVDDVISGIVLAAGDVSEDNDFDEIVPPVPPASIHGTVFEDLNNDGVLDAGEPPIQGVTVTLGGDATAVATTDAAGEYWFEDLLPGEYTVTETQPAGFLDGIDTAGTSGGDDTAVSYTHLTLPTILLV